MAITATHHAVQYHWNELPKEAIGAKITRQFFNGETMTIARLELKKGAHIRSHSHEAEEVMCVLKGDVTVTIDGEDHLVHAGDVMDIPGGLVHEVTAAENCDLLYAFSPLRTDWIEKKDTYYER